MCSIETHNLYYIKLSKILNINVCKNILTISFYIFKSYIEIQIYQTSHQKRFGRFATFLILKDFFFCSLQVCQLHQSLCSSMFIFIMHRTKYYHPIFSNRDTQPILIFQYDPLMLGQNMVPRVTTLKQS